MISINIYNSITGQYSRTTTGPTQVFDNGMQVLDNEVAFMTDESHPEQYYYDANTRELVFFGTPATPYHTFNFLTKQWEINFDKAKREKKFTIDLYKDELNNAPIEYQGAMYDGNQSSKTALLSWQMQILLGNSVPVGFVWLDVNNVEHPADNQFILNLSQLLTERNSQLAQIAWTTKAEVDTLTDINAIMNYDYKSKFN